jgi:hypothetical protein
VDLGCLGGLVTPSWPCVIVCLFPLQVAKKVDVIYALSQAWTFSESAADFEMLSQRLSDLTPDERVLVRKSFFL